MRKQVTLEEMEGYISFGVIPSGGVRLSMRMLDTHVILDLSRGASCWMQDRFLHLGYLMRERALPCDAKDGSIRPVVDGAVEAYGKRLDCSADPLGMDACDFRLRVVNAGGEGGVAARAACEAFDASLKEERDLVEIYVDSRMGRHG